jgi:hypothetical protein
LLSLLSFCSGSEITARESLEELSSLVMKLERGTSFRKEELRVAPLKPVILGRLTGTKGALYSAGAGAELGAGPSATGFMISPRVSAATPGRFAPSSFPLMLTRARGDDGPLLGRETGMPCPVVEDRPAMKMLLPLEIESHSAESIIRSPPLVKSAAPTLPKLPFPELRITLVASAAAVPLMDASRSLEPATRGHARGAGREVL